LTCWLALLWSLSFCGPALSSCRSCNCSWWARRCACRKLGPSWGLGDAVMTRFCWSFRRFVSRLIGRRLRLDLLRLFLLPHCLRHYWVFRQWKSRWSNRFWKRWLGRRLLRWVCLWFVLWSRFFWNGRDWSWRV
jgi:hypothetical protein